MWILYRDMTWIAETLEPGTLLLKRDGWKPEVVKEEDCIFAGEPVHNHGFVRLVDTMGDDFAIVQAARVSYGSGSKGPEADAKLINYLMKNRHTSPFEHVEFKFHVSAPLFVARQWVRHRTANWNEVSGRYTQLEERFWIPESLRYQDSANKQGSVGEIPDSGLIEAMSENNERCYALYESLLKQGVCREQARTVLPLSVYTEWYWKIDLHNLLHFLRLRMDSHSQQEMRDYANVIGKIVKSVCPITWACFKGKDDGKD